MAKDDQDAEVSEGGGKKKLIIIGAAVVVALILGVVVFMTTGKDKTAAKKDAGEAKVEAKAEAGGHGAEAAPAGKEGAAAAASNMYPLEPFIVNIYDGQELRYLKVKVEAEMATPNAKLDLDSRLAPIRDAVLVLLSTKTLQDIQDVAGKTQLKDEILSAINKNIPPGKILRVYFTDFVVQ